jgi:hypothetical protein
MRLPDNRHFAALILDARAHAEHPGYLALQPIFELIEWIAARLLGHDERRDEVRHSRSSFPPGV